MTVNKKHFFDFLWDSWCVASGIGIWPRFIEPNLLNTTYLNLPLKGLPKELEKLTIVQFSDLHLHPKVPRSFLVKLQKKIEQLKPDILVFTGDFLCYCNVSEKERLIHFLNQFHAPLGCFAILGNHDYTEVVSIDDQGNYDLYQRKKSQIGQGFHRFFNPIKPTGFISEAAKKVPVNQELIEIIASTPFQLLNNQTKFVKVEGSGINITGLGEYMLGRLDPQKAFENYDPGFPGIVLSHNPDSIPLLSKYPGDVILSGHTHGAQVNLPFIWEKLALMEHPQFVRGLVRYHDKWVYTNRGVGSTLPFRWFSTPEILNLTLKHEV